MDKFQLTKLRIQFERAEREYQDAKKYLEPVMEDIRLRLYGEHEKAIKAYGAYADAGREIGLCVGCSNALDGCTCGPWMATHLPPQPQPPGGVVPHAPSGETT